MDSNIPTPPFAVGRQSDKVAEDVETIVEKIYRCGTRPKCVLLSNLPWV
jgi:hypothetical protein